MADPGSATRGALLREGGGGDPLTVRYTLRPRFAGAV